MLFWLTSKTELKILWFQITELNFLPLRLHCPEMSWSHAWFWPFQLVCNRPTFCHRLRRCHDRKPKSCICFWSARFSSQINSDDFPSTLALGILMFLTSLRDVARDVSDEDNFRVFDFSTISDLLENEEEKTHRCVGRERNSSSQGSRDSGSNAVVQNLVVVARGVVIRTDCVWHFRGSLTNVIILCRSRSRGWGRQWKRLTSFYEPRQMLFRFFRRRHVTWRMMFLINKLIFFIYIL